MYTALTVKAPKSVSRSLDFLFNTFENQLKTTLSLHHGSMHFKYNQYKANTFRFIIYTR